MQNELTMDDLMSLSRLLRDNWGVNDFSEIDVVRVECYDKWNVIEKKKPFREWLFIPVLNYLRIYCMPSKAEKSLHGDEVIFDAKY